MDFRFKGMTLLSQINKNVIYYQDQRKQFKKVNYDLNKFFHHACTVMFDLKGMVLGQGGIIIVIQTLLGGNHH